MPITAPAVVSGPDGCASALSYCTLATPKSDAEVEDLHGAIVGQKYVRRLDVSVDYALLMRDIEAVEELADDRACLGLGERSAPLERRAERLAIDGLHDEIGMSRSEDAGVEDRHERAMV